MNTRDEIRNSEKLWCKFIFVTRNYTKNKSMRNINTTHIQIINVNF